MSDITFAWMEQYMDALGPDGDDFTALEAALQRKRWAPGEWDSVYRRTIDKWITEVNTLGRRWDVMGALKFDPDNWPKYLLILQHLTALAPYDPETHFAQHMRRKAREMAGQSPQTQVLLNSDIGLIKYNFADWRRNRRLVANMM